MAVRTEQSTLESTKNKRRWFAVFALSSASMVDAMESFGVEILWPYMYPSLGLSISMLAPLLSISRLISTITTPIWGAIADRYSRKALLIVMTGLWGIWTGMVGFVQSFWQLMAVRLASSLGLAVLYPVAYSIISDLFRRDERARAIGVMGAFGFAGDMVSMGVLGTLAVANPEAWRYGFMLMGLLSLLTGLLIVFIKEPARGTMEPELSDVVSEDNQFLFEWNKLPGLFTTQSYWVIMINEIIDWIGFSILSAWAFTWLSQQDLGQGTMLVMLLLFLGVILGHLIFGWMSDRLDSRFPKYGRIVLGHTGLFLNALASLGFLLFGMVDIFYLLVTGLVIGLSFSMKETGARIPLLQNILLPELRASGRAFIEVIKGLVLAGAISLSGWALNRLGENLQMMMLIFVPTSAFLAALVWIFLYRTYPDDLKTHQSTLKKQRQAILEKRKSHLLTNQQDVQ